MRNNNVADLAPYLANNAYFISYFSPIYFQTFQLPNPTQDGVIVSGSANVVLVHGLSAPPIANPGNKKLSQHLRA